MLADPADGQKLGWDMDSERMGSPGGRVCETLRGLRSVFCLQSARRRLRTGRAHVLAWGTPRSARFAFGMCRVTSWLHMWLESGRKVKPCQMVPSKKDEVREQLHDVTGKVQGALAASCHAGAAQNKIKKKSWVKQDSLLGEQDSRGRGERPPVLGTGNTLLGGWVSGS